MAFRRSPPDETPHEIAFDIDEEIAEHLRRRTEDLVREGLAESDARRRALEEFGDLDEARREIGAIEVRIAARRRRTLGGETGWRRAGTAGLQLAHGSGPWRVALGAPFHPLLDDGRLAVKRLWTRPGSATMAAVMLAAAIGLTAAMFTVVDAMLLRPVPFRDHATLAVIEMPAIDGPHPGVNVPLSIVDAWQSSGVFDAAHGALSVAGVLEGGAEPVRLSTDVVTPGLFEMLGARPLLGRAFVDGDGRAGSEETVILSERAWRAVFAADPSILGRSILVSGVPTRVIGVMPTGFRFTDSDTDLWLPIDAGAPRARHEEMGLWVYARLPADIPATDVLRRATRIARETDAWAEGHRATARPLTRDADPYTRRAIFAVSGGVILVFLVLCANAANLLLGRLSSRRREFATASALGASRGRLLRQALAEHAILGLAASALGVVVGAGLVSWAGRWLTDNSLLRTLNPVELDLRALLAASLAGVVATLLAGGLPAWSATTPRAATRLRTLVDRTGTEPRSARFLARALLVTEIAFAVALLVGAGVLLRSFVNLMRVDLGMDADRVMVVELSLPRHVDAFEDRGANLALVGGLVEELDALPDIEASTLSSRAPPDSPPRWSGDFLAEGRPEPTSLESVSVYRVGAEFFEVYGIPIVRGRPFRPGDGDSAVVIGERLARILWPAGTAAGSSLRWGRMSLQVVGVAREIRTRRWPDPRDDALEMYRLHRPDGGFLLGATISLRCASVCPPAALVRQRVHAVNPRLLVDDVRRVSDAYVDELARPRAAAALAAGFAMIATLTFAGGLFSALHYAVRRRLPELGIRAALGASTARLGRTVLREGLSVAVAGLGCGGLAAGWLSRWLASITYEAPAPGAALWVFVSVVVVATTLAGAWSPARRAMRVDPVQLLRDE